MMYGHSITDVIGRLTPALPWPGDEVAIVSGLDIQCLLQRKEGRGSEHEFVGTGYVHRMIDGEMIGK
jgi:hypothetical protein